MKTKIGRRATDIITGFEGTITGHCEYITGCSQLLVVPISKDGSKAEPAWFDEQRLRVDMLTPAVVLDNGATPGCDVSAPIR